MGAADGQGLDTAGEGKGLMERAEIINARLIVMALDLAAALIRAEKALAPFDEMAGEMFARNWNDDGVAISFITQNGPLRLTFKEFRAVRAALSEIKKLRGE